MQDLEDRLSATITEQDHLTEIDHQRLLTLGKDLEMVWNHPQAPVELKKRILRCVLEEIVVDLSEHPPEIHLWLHWAGGVHTELCVPKNRTGRHRYCTDREVVEMVRDLAKVCEDRFIAAILNRLGYQTGAGNTWKESRVRSLRDYHQIPAFDPESRRAWLTLAESAHTLGVSPKVVRRLLEQGILPGRQVAPVASWMIERENLDLAEVRQIVEAIKRGRRPPRTPSGEVELPLFFRDS